MNLELDDFKSWLLAKDSNEIVGERRDSCKCPIANWINSLEKYDEKVSVNHHWVYIPSGSPIKAESWMKRFIMYTDIPSNPLCNVEEALFTLVKIGNRLGE